MTKWSRQRRLTAAENVYFFCDLAAVRVHRRRMAEASRNGSATGGDGESVLPGGLACRLHRIGPGSPLLRNRERGRGWRVKHVRREPGGLAVKLSERPREGSAYHFYCISSGSCRLRIAEHNVLRV